MTSKQLARLCRTWQRRLRLQDWIVRVSFTRARNMRSPGAEGNCFWEVRTKEADIQILHPIDVDHDRIRPFDAEQVLVHELLHIQWAGLESLILDFAKSPEGIAAEQAIDKTAWALVRGYRGGN